MEKTSTQKFITKLVISMVISLFWLGMKELIGFESIALIAMATICAGME